MPALYNKENRRHVLLEHSPLRIGRHPDNDLVLFGMEVSRRHCELRRDLFGNWLVKQLGSADPTKGTYNVTFVRRAGQVIEVKPSKRAFRLQGGDEVAFGKRRQDREPDFRFKYVVA